MSSEWANLVSLDSTQHEQSYFEVRLGVQLSLDWNGTGRTSVSPYRTLAVCFLEPDLGSQNKLTKFAHS